MGIIKKLFGGNKKTDAEIQAEVLKKATAHMNASNELTGIQANAATGVKPVYQDIDQIKKKNIRKVLLEIAERGETGILSTSISDKAGISKQETSSALSYLTQNNYVESVNNPSGVKFYITALGKKFCISKEFNSEF